MEDESTETPGKPPETDWADLRAKAAKLGITLSQLQQQQREQERRRANKRAPRPTRD
jgi:hypothetical protein